MREKIHLPDGLDGAVWGHAWRARLHPRHTHDELELNLIVAGSGSYLLPDRRVPLDRGTLLWLFSGCEHMLAELSSDFRMWIVILRPSAVRRLVTGKALPAILLEADPPGLWSRHIPEATLRSLDALLGEVATDHQAPATINAGLAWAVSRAWAAFDCGSEVASLAQVHPGVREAIRRLAQPGPAPTARALARACGLSPDRLARVFHLEIGERIATFRNRIRVARAQALIAAGGKDMTTVALESGFTSYTHFHRCFTRLAGIPPSKC